MKIEATDRCIASHKQGTLKATKAQIVEVLGFEPNVEDDPAKVVNSWGFTIDGEDAAIWDYKGSHEHNEYSYFNPKVAELFAKKNPVAKQKLNVPITARTVHLAGAKHTAHSKTLWELPWIGGKIRVFTTR